MKTWNDYCPKQFRYKGKWVYNWFSNMEISYIVIDGMLYKSVEHYYQSQKTHDPRIRDLIAKSNSYGARMIGREIRDIRPDWDQVKEEVMRKALYQKWTQEPWKSKLLRTGTNMLIEWNNWGDRFWGVSIDDCKGENKLGLILMEIREKLTQLQNEE